MSCYLRLDGIIEIVPGEESLIAKRSLDYSKIVITVCNNDCGVCAEEIFPECKKAKNIFSGK